MTLNDLDLSLHLQIPENEKINRNRVEIPRKWWLPTLNYRLTSGLLCFVVKLARLEWHSIYLRKLFQNQRNIDFTLT